MEEENDNSTTPSEVDATEVPTTFLFTAEGDEDDILNPTAVPSSLLDDNQTPRPPLSAIFEDPLEAGTNETVVFPGEQEEGVGGKMRPEFQPQTPPELFDPSIHPWGSQDIGQPRPLAPSFQEHPEQNMAVVGVLIALICILIVILFVVTIPPLLHMIRRKMPIPKARIDRRYATIDAWLVRKRVQPHDDACECIQNRYCDHKSIPTATEDVICTTVPLTAAIVLKKMAPAHADDEEKNENGNNSSTSLPNTTGADGSEESASIASDDADRDQPECAICLDVFRTGEVVAWSTDPHCGHVFHHKCIREWLLRRIACPCCRKVVLPVDRPLVAASRQRTEEGGNNDGPVSQPSEESFDQQAGGEPAPTTPAAHPSAPTKPFRLTQAMMKSYAQERVKRTTTSYYCVQEGLITLDSFGVSRNQNEVKTMADRMRKRLKSSSSSGKNTTQTIDTTSRAMEESSLIYSWWDRFTRRVGMRRSETGLTAATSTGDETSTRNLARDIPLPPSPDETFDMQDDDDDDEDDYGTDLERQGGSLASSSVPPSNESVTAADDIDPLSSDLDITTEESRNAIFSYFTGRTLPSAQEEPDASPDLEVPSAVTADELVAELSSILAIMEV